MPALLRACSIYKSFDARPLAVVCVAVFYSMKESHTHRMPALLLACSALVENSDNYRLIYHSMWMFPWNAIVEFYIQILME